MAPIAVVARAPVPAEAFERFPGRWIALRDGEVVADAATPEELRQDERVDADDTLFLVPDPSTHFFSVRVG
jgi:hypothetical protein